MPNPMQQRCGVSPAPRFRGLRSILSGLALVAVFVIAAPAISQEIKALPTLGVELEKTTDIKSQPLALLSKFPTAGPGLARFVAETLLRAPDAADAVLSIIPDTSPEQAAAISAGIVRAVRAFGSKHPDIVNMLKYKIMQTDNAWLKTTFRAIGPQGVAKPPATDLVAFDSYPFPTADNAGGAGGAAQLGDKLEDELGRAGPSIITDRNATLIGNRDMAPFLSPLNNDLTRYGMIVAIVTSDAGDNGAVSTSPTI